MTKPADDFMETALEMPGLIAADSSQAPAVPPTTPNVIAVASESKPGRTHDPISECIIRFTDELRAGMRPNIEEYLSEVAPPWREALFAALLRAELESQSDSDEPLFIFRGQYLDRFPDRKAIVERLLSELEARISTVSHSDPVTGPTETVAAPKTSQPAISLPRVVTAAAASGTMARSGWLSFIQTSPSRSRATGTGSRSTARCSVLAAAASSPRSACCIAL